jgi:protein-disulfide isomerase
MKTSWMFRTQVLALVVGLLFCGNAVAQNTGATAGEQQQAGQDVQAELAAIKAELKAVRTDLQKVLAELKAVKTAQAKAPAPQKRQQRPKDTTIYDIDLSGSPIRGPEDAKITIVEYASFKCGWCIREAPVIKEVMEAYPKDVRLVFKHFPMWDKAKPAHAAAELAYKQKGNEGFWNMHDLIIGAPKKLETADLRKHAETLGMDLAEFDKVMADSTQVATLADKDTAKGKAYNVTGTPGVFINGLRLSPRGLDNYKARIDEILKGGGKKKAGLPATIKKVNVKGGK